MLGSRTARTAIIKGIVAVFALLSVVGCSGGSDELFVDSTEVLLTVNGVEIIEQQIAIVATNLRIFVEVNATAEAEGSFSQDYFRADVSDYGATVVGLGEMIRITAQSSRAEQLGLAAEEAAIAERIQTHRSAVESRHIPGLQEAVTEAGSHSYWNDYAPEFLRRQYMSVLLSNHVGNGVTLVDGTRQSQSEYLEEVVRTANIAVVGDHSAVDEETVAAAMAYLEEHYQEY